MKKIKLVFVFITILFNSNTFAQTKEYTDLLGKALNTLYADLPRNCMYSIDGKLEELPLISSFKSKVELPNSIRNYFDFYPTDLIPFIFKSWLPETTNSAQVDRQLDGANNAILATTINYKNKNYKFMYLPTESKAKNNIGSNPDYKYKLENGPLEFDNIRVYAKLGLNMESTMDKIRIEIGIYKQNDKKDSIKLKAEQTLIENQLGNRLNTYYLFNKKSTLFNSAYYNVTNVSNKTTTSYAISCFPYIGKFVFEWQNKTKKENTRSIIIKMHSLLNATKYINFFEQESGSVLEKESGVLFLSRKNYLELKSKKGTTTLDVGNGQETFKYIGDYLTMNGRIFSCESRNAEIEVLDDEYNSLIIKIKTSKYVTALVNEK